MSEARDRAARVRGLDAFARRDWSEACRELEAADIRDPLDAPDLETLAVATYLLGRDDDSAKTWARAHQDWLRHGENERAARCAFWLGFGLMLRAEMAPAAGWLGRAERLAAADGV